MPKETRHCSICEKPVTRYPSLFYGEVLCSKECRAAWLSRKNHGENNPDWKGGRYIEPGKGYVMIRNPEHPRARKNGYVLEHILVMESVLGRSLEPSERVHHKNHIQDDNRPENLQLYGSNGDHLRTEGHHRKRQDPCQCGLVAVARGLCSTHYAQFRRTGKTWGHGLPERS